METMVINRSKWVSAPCDDNCAYKGDSMLLNENGNMCCLGFLSLKRGLKKKEIDGCCSPKDVVSEHVLHRKAHPTFPLDGSVYKEEIERLSKKLGDMLGKKTTSNSRWCNQAMRINDDCRLTLEEIEKKLIVHFKKIDINLKFVGKYGIKKEEEED